MSPLTNYLAFADPESSRSRIGHLDWDNSTVQPLSFSSGRYLDNLYQVIQLNENQIIPAGDTIPLSSVKILPPIAGRDILAVGKNYTEHAAEFHKSGYDSSDKVVLPSHPVLFTKRATSIIAHGHPIELHHQFTKTLDYEGEVGVIIGKGGFGIKAENAMDHVWGYTIINDVTARERQRDHKQFFIGKSGDTYCPIGPIAVPAKHLPDILSVKTFVNGEQRQIATTDQLIFSVASLIETLSEGITLQPGDVIATGTPAGVGFGQDPPTFLQPGDEVTVTVTGLGSLRNKIVTGSSDVSSAASYPDLELPYANTARTVTGESLVKINGKSLYYKSLGPKEGPHVVFVHGLGGSQEFYKPLISALGLDQTHRLHLVDLEGHGLSPTSSLSNVSIESYAEDIRGVFDLAGINESSGATVIAHSMGCHIALTLTRLHGSCVKNLILIGPPPSPLPQPAVSVFTNRAATVRREGMTAVVDAVADAGVSSVTKSNNAVAVASVRLSLLGTDPEGYAKGCAALAGGKAIGLRAISARTLIITGDEDKVSPSNICEQYSKAIPKSEHPAVLQGVGHWHVFEDVKGTGAAIRRFL